MLKRILLLTLTVYAAASLSIPQPAHAQFSEFKLTASDGAEFDSFGNSVSISGDYAVVGAPGNDDNGDRSGSAYVFKRSGTSWTEEAKLLPSDGAAGDGFGVSVSISGDYALVGASGNEDNGTFSGSAYVFKRTGTSWTQEAKLLPSDGAAGDIFGAEVSISGDYALVGAEQDDDNGNLSGSAYVFKRTGTSWAQEAKLLPSDGAAEDFFGSVSISGDYAVVGASGDGSGSAYVFKRAGTSWVQEAKLLPSDGAAHDYFGWSVSISGDYAVVGAIWDDDNGDRSGSAYVFKRSGTSWVQEAKLLPNDGAAFDRFGYSVSISGDYAVMGAYRDDDNGASSGSAYVFKRSGTSWAQEAKLLASDGAADDWFGWSVSISGDYAVAGARFDDDNGDRSGSAYVYNFFTFPISMGEVSVSPSYAVPGMDSIVVTAAVVDPAVLSLFVEIESPNEVPLDTLPLFDDGAHHDGEAGDSLFGNSWLVSPVEERLYFVDLHVTYVDTDTLSFQVDNAARFTTIGPVVFDSYMLLEDTIINPGDLIDMILTLRNDGSIAAATNVSAEISTVDNCVSDIPFNSAPFGDIAPGETATATVTYVIETSASCSAPTDISFDLTIASGSSFDLWSDSFTIHVVPIGIAAEGTVIPESYSLSQNYPNPFNPVTVLRYALPEVSDISLVIYNLRGQEVRRWDIQGQPAGNHRVSWDASSFASGVYLYRLQARPPGSRTDQTNVGQAGDFVQTRKMVLLK